MMTTTFSVFSQHLDLLPPHNVYSPRTCLFSVHKHHFVPAPSLPLPQTQGRVHNLADFFVGVENYVFSRLRPGRQVTTPLLPSMIQCSIPAEQPLS